MRGKWNRLRDKLWRDNHGNGSDVQEFKEVGYNCPRKVPLKRQVSCGWEDRKELGQCDAGEKSGNERDSTQSMSLHFCFISHFSQNLTRHLNMQIVIPEGIVVDGVFLRHGYAAYSDETTI